MNSRRRLRCSSCNPRAHATLHYAAGTAATSFTILNRMSAYLVGSSAMDFAASSSVFDSIAFSRSCTPMLPKLDMRAASTATPYFLTQISKLCKYGWKPAQREPLPASAPLELDCTSIGSITSHACVSQSCGPAQGNFCTPWAPQRLLHKQAVQHTVHAERLVCCRVLLYGSPRV